MRYLNLYEQFMFESNEQSQTEKKYKFDVLNEEVSSTQIFHYTTLSNLYLILKSNTMFARYVGDRSSDLWRKVSNKSISFSRRELNSSQLFGISDGQSEPLSVKISFDYDKLKKNYKIVPWSDARPKQNTSDFQFEERCTTDIEDIRNYIKNITIYDYTPAENIKYGGKGDISGELPLKEFLVSDFLKINLYNILTYTDKESFRNEQNIISDIQKSYLSLSFGFMNSKIMSYLWSNYIFKEIKKNANGIRLDIKKTGSDLYFTDDIKVLSKKLMKQEYIIDFKNCFEIYVDSKKSSYRERTIKEENKRLKEESKQKFIDSLYSNRNDVEKKRQAIRDYEYKKNQKEYFKLGRTLAKKIEESQIFKDFKSKLYKKFPNIIIKEDSNLYSLFDRIESELFEYEEDESKSYCRELILGIKSNLIKQRNSYHDIKDILEKINQLLKELTSIIPKLRKIEILEDYFKKFTDSNGEDDTFEKYINEKGDVDMMTAQDVIKFIFFSKDKKLAIGKINKDLFNKFIKFLSENKETLLIFTNDGILESIKDNVGHNSYTLSFLNKKNIIDYYRQISSYINDDDIDTFLKNNTIEN
jgi:hypothetical protein